MSSIILPSAFAEETTKQNWEYYLARPFSLFGGSLWNYWHSSDQIFEILGIKLTDVLLVETHPNFVRKYGLGKQIKGYKEAIKNLTRDIEHTKNLLRIGLELNEEALTKLRNKQFLTFEEEIEFIVKVALHATVIPCFVYDLFIEGGDKDSELEKLCESLQAKSLYPRLMKNIIIPLAQKKLGELNIKDTSKNIELITLSELLSGKTDMLSKRRSKREKNFFFVYQNLDGKELVE